MSNKKLLFVMPVMKGGGAEKVAALLLNEFNKNGFDGVFDHDRADYDLDSRRVCA